MHSTSRSKSNKWELFRFIVCGAACALFDYLVCQLVVLLFNKVNPNFNDNLLTVISTFFGFVVGVIMNYLISTFWVYQNVREDINTKRPLFIVVFVLLSVASLGLCILTMLSCNLFCSSVFNIDITTISLFDLISSSGIGFLKEGIFWCYFISFCLKTLVGLVFNYFTRKYILYKAPKHEEKNNEQ